MLFYIKTNEFQVKTVDLKLKLMTIKLQSYIKNYTINNLFTTFISCLFVVEGINKCINNYR